MDAFEDRHAYRCLPLTIANTHGWQVLAPVDFEVSWNGGASAKDLTVEALGAMPGNAPFEHFATSNFSRGVVTMHTGYLFRTPPGWNLLAGGPFNTPKPGIAPLTGIMETDWLPYPFTMNWQMLQPGAIRFEKQEPFCAIMPVPKNYLPEWQVAIHNLADDPVLAAEHETFRDERTQFMQRLRAADAETLKQAWQKHYFLGRHPDGTKVGEHVNRMRLARPQDHSGTTPLHANPTPASPLAASLLAARNAPKPRQSPPRAPMQVRVTCSLSLQLDADTAPKSGTVAGPVVAGATLLP
jgi:Family of unknown function (DUF6065)